MATIQVGIPASHVVRPVDVNLLKDTPLHVMMKIINIGDAPSAGSIWKMTKTGRADTGDPVEVSDYFNSLEANGIADTDSVELVDFHL
ncbi:MAG: hypothetical protein IH596_04370 [Bacteroidales bacterium]|nr:hypothetical protein [Bacteroidales bacterium]